MTTTTHDTGRTAHLLALMKKGDDAFNARDFATVDTVHHPDMIAYIPGLAEPSTEKKHTPRRCSSSSASSPTCTSTAIPTPSSSAPATGSPSSPTPPGPSAGR
jgi:hypothetical protein